MALEIQVDKLKKTSASGGSRLLKSIGAGRSPTASDRMFFTEQLALLLETGESLYAALGIIAKQTENAELTRIIEDIAEGIGEGKSFGSALAQHDKVFSSTYVNLIAASESGGFMHEVLQQLLEMDQRREKLRSTIVSAATYPLFLIAFSIAVVVFVLVVVFPKFGTMFHSIYEQLPATTKGLMAISELLRSYWWLLLASIAALATGLLQWVRSEPGRATIDGWLLRLPGVRDIFVQIYLVQSLQVMSLSLRNGVSVMDSLEACRDVVRNTVFRSLITAVEEKVQAGAGVAAGFDEADFVPELARHMIATGEQTGNLGKVMGRVGDYYETQLGKKLEMVTKLAEPIMLLVMGIVVGVIVSSLILPIFKLSRAVS
ncbi:MAG: type II secretion system F family protein [Woeseiaceae bacterium]|nr:type II secretion system F family protein [Woeseiaceae bacterium]